ncbi:protein adenylyltransferase SelO family protein [Ponticaulis sp.]|uniref:protein adenylyltransferase SelO family protein n=1 Tax=Ponticaulis sp. TaxID=2020902 RepID=UPI000C6787C4|nr:YdiU family protein [Ponticaulis sp.]MAJ10723.1 selenoprotein O [Ponticaulis sp.]HBH90845.1 YdiU family protein [Hyphomonadaceae bacterium]HBJ93991.1 YdiU family protein [Hyphomonadaceae bacterium]|tara:strand:+ start:9822 stop:11219 length:1398 start_codon:yes stop_codon:yes gene_type:complete
MKSNTPFTALGNDFADAVEPANFPDLVLRYRNNRVLNKTILHSLSPKNWLNHFGRFAPLPENQPKPLAIRYHGHQFRSYNPQIGDGRGFLYAQLHDEHDQLYDLGTKGSGQTPHSRSGDGRLTLKGGVREVLATEMLEASHVPTSKTLSLIETGEELYRNDEPSPARSSVLVRVQKTHVRFGIFQRLAFYKDAANMETLLDYCRTHFFAEIDPAPAAELAPLLLTEITKRTANMVASWMAAGFVHGVMNTDNMVVTGETFDFGPYRFMPVSDPKFTAAYFDEWGLYAFGRQPQAAIWNLQQLAGALTLVAEAEDLSESLGAFELAYQTALRDHTFFQLGLLPEHLETDLNFLTELFGWMTQSQVPWHQFFFDWFCGEKSETRANNSPSAELYTREDFGTVREYLRHYKDDRPERLAHPYFQRPSPETLLIDEIETLWSAIVDNDDWSLFEAKLNGIAEKRKALLG